MYQKVLVIVLQLIVLTTTSPPQKLPLLTDVSCYFDKDCKENSFCFGNDLGRHGNCKCKPGFDRFGNKTYYECLEPIAGIGSSCLLDVQCELVLGLDSECDIRNKCACLPTAHYLAEKNACYKTSKINEECLSHENCVGVDSNVYCTNGKCTCGLNQHPTLDGRCSDTRSLGEHCTNDDNCWQDNAVCRIKCVCRAGYVLSDNGEACLKAAITFGEPCQQLSQCTKYLNNAVCSEGVCWCDSAYHTFESKCFLTRQVGEPCRHDLECVLDSSQIDSRACISGVCAIVDSNRTNSVRRWQGEVLGLLTASVLFMLL